MTGHYITLYRFIQLWIHVDLYEDDHWHCILTKTIFGLFWDLNQGPLDPGACSLSTELYKPVSGSNGPGSNPKTTQNTSRLIELYLVLDVCMLPWYSYVNEPQVATVGATKVCQIVQKDVCGEKLKLFT